MRGVLLFVAILVAFAGTLFGALQLMDSGDAPAAIANQPVERKARPFPVAAAPKPTVAPKPRKSAAERSGDRWVNQADAICGQFERQILALMQNRTPRTSTVSLFRKAYRYERATVVRLHGLRRPSGLDGPLVDRLMRLLDRHVAAFDAALDAMEARDGKRIERLVAELAALTKDTEHAAAKLGAFRCAYGGS